MYVKHRVLGQGPHLYGVHLRKRNWSKCYWKDWNLLTGSETINSLMGTANRAYMTQHSVWASIPGRILRISFFPSIINTYILTLLSRLRHVLKVISYKSTAEIIFIVSRTFYSGLVTKSVQITLGSIDYTTCHRTSTQAAHSVSTAGNPTRPTMNSYSPHILGVTDMSMKITQRLAAGMWYAGQFRIPHSWYVSEDKWRFKYFKSTLCVPNLWKRIQYLRTSIALVVDSNLLPLAFFCDFNCFTATDQVRAWFPVLPKFSIIPIHLLLNYNKYFLSLYLKSGVMLA
jgi:hypothetical protein